MRQFLVLGFASNSASEPGQCLYLGTDRGEALRVVNEPGTEVRRELYDLANPHLRRHFAPTVAAQDLDDQDPDDQDPEDPAAKKGNGKK